jgi:spore coat polysaccharide biosynthesis protein SpsF
VRVNGDSPLLDHRLVEKAVELFRNGNYDMVTNIMQRTFPPGQSVEVLRSETFRQTYRLMNTTDDLEHVTKFFYRNSEDFKILNFVYDFDCHDVSFAIDTADDLDVFANLVSRMTKPHWEYSLPEILELYRNAIGQAEKFN